MNEIYIAIKDLAEEINLELKKERGFSKSVWKKICDFGLVSVLTPDSVGGMGKSYTDILKIARYMGYVIKDSGFVFAINNSLIVSSYLLPNFANDVIKNDVYPGLYNGEHLAAYAITESESGSDVFNMKTTYKTVEDGYVLNGSKTYISNASIADVFAVVAKRDNEISIFLIKKDDIGFSVEYEIEKMGLESCPMGEIVLNNCFIKEDRVIGKIGEGMVISNKVLEWERVCSFASHLGTMQRIMEQCIKYVNLRKTHGKRLGGNQMISEKISKMKIKIELGNLLLEKIMRMKDEGRNTFLESAMFKYFVGESYAEVCIEAMQIHGAYGYSKEGEFEQEVRDSLGSKIYSGTSEIQLDIISRMCGIKK